MQNIERGQPKMWQKIAVCLFMAIIMFFVVSSLIGNDSSSTTNNKQTAPEFESVINQKDITVKSLSIKDVGGKYDYWFDIRNNSTSTYNGQVHIELINESGKKIEFGDFKSDSDIQPTKGDFVKITSKISPRKYITGFRYWAKENDVLVKNGTGSFANIEE